MIEQLKRAFLLAALVIPAQLLHAQDWPMWGGTPSRNMVSDQRGLPESFAVVEVDPPTTRPDLSKSTNLKWAAPLGSQSYGNPTIVGGRVYVGTNNDPGMVLARSGDLGVAACLDEKTGKLIWQLSSPKLRVGEVSDFEQVGICSSPTVENDRVYLVTNRCEVICLDAKGLYDGNDGEFRDEAGYIAGAGDAPVTLVAEDADILWVYDMRDELGSFPHQMTSSSVLIVGSRLYVTTSNGRDWTNTHIPSPNAPALICLDKQTGKLVGEERSGISSRTFRCNWSSPTFGMVDGKGRIFFGGDDGFCYAFDPEPDAGVLKEVWRLDCNPPEYRTGANGAPIRFGQPKGPSGILATPVFHNNRIFIAIGQDPGQGEGAGALLCIDAGTGKQVWVNKQIGRSLSTVAVTNELLFTADLAGKVYCLDPGTGAEIWKHDAEGAIWGSPLVADGKLYIGTENSTLWVLGAAKEKKVLQSITLSGSILSTPVAANNVLYVMTARALYAAERKR